MSREENVALLYAFSVVSEKCFSLKYLFPYPMYLILPSSVRGENHIYYIYMPGVYKRFHLGLRLDTA